MALVQAKCTNCGANIEVDQTKEAGICPYCNTAYITQKAIINYNSTIINNYSINADTVNITGPNFDNLMKSAMSAFDGGNFSAAEEKFSRALEITPDSVEARLYWSLCDGWTNNNFRNVMKTFHDIFDNVDFASDDVKTKLLYKHLTNLQQLLNAYSSYAIKSYDPDCSDSSNIEYVWEQLEESIHMRNIGISFLRKIVSKSDTYAQLLLAYSQQLVDDCSTLCDKWRYDTHVTGGLVDIRTIYHPKRDYYVTLIENTSEEIQKYDPEYMPPSTTKRGCYIATSVYGSYDCPEVWVLRRYRDFTLSKTTFGRAFIKFYYKVSPKLVKKFGECKTFRNFWRKKLDKLVIKLKKKGTSDLPYRDIDWN